MNVKNLIEGKSSVLTIIVAAVLSIYIVYANFQLAKQKI